MVTAGALWTGAVGGVVLHATGAVGAWVTTAAAVVATMAATTTLAALLLATLPPVLVAWDLGATFGARVERERAGSAAAPRRRLSSVR